MPYATFEVKGTVKAEDTGESVKGIKVKLRHYTEGMEDDNGNPLSLSHYLELIGVEFDGTAHDPLYDAVNLGKLYNIFLIEKDIVLEQYLKVLKRGSFGPKPVSEAIHKLVNGEAVTPEEFVELIKDYIK